MSSSKQAATNDPTALIKGMYRALAQRDRDYMASALADDFVVTEAGSLPYGGTFRGVDGLLALIDRFTGTWDNLRIRTIDFTASDQRVAVHIDFSATGKTTGIEIAFPIIEVWKIDGGKIHSMTALYFDTQLANKAAGHPGASGAA